eukprot:7386146-Prymnesium_polylepis.2
MIVRLPLCITMRVIAIWVVLHVTGSVEASSCESGKGFSVRNWMRAPAKHARGDWPSPSTASPTAYRACSFVAMTTPEQSVPGGPGSPGYSPSTLSTSRKLRPTARTVMVTSDPSLGSNGS